MPEGTTASLLRRLARPAAPPLPLTPARALRLAMVRSAEASVGLTLAVLGIREEEGPLDDLLGRLEEGLMVLSLEEQGGEPVGLVALDLEARSAAAEAQALGQVLDRPAEPRAPTAADAALARPLLAAFLAQAEEAVAGTPLEGWLRAPRPAERLAGAREAALLLADGAYRAVRLTLDLGPGGRQGLLVLLLRLPPPPPPAGPAPDSPAASLAPAVLRARTQVEAVLARLRLPLSEVEGFAPGQVLSLPGVTVASVRLEAAGHDLGPTRLGQVAGMRAVRIESPLAPELAALGQPALPGSLPGGTADSGASGWDAEENLPPLEPAWPLSERAEAPVWGPPARD